MSSRKGMYRPGKVVKTEDSDEEEAPAIEESAFSAKEGKRCPHCRKKVEYGTREKSMCNGLCTGSQRGKLGKNSAASAELRSLTKADRQALGAESTVEKVEKVPKSSHPAVPNSTPVKMQVVITAEPAPAAEERDLCSGDPKFDGSQCPRKATEEGGNEALGLCRRCFEKQEAVNTRAREAAAAAEASAAEEPKSSGPSSGRVPVPKKVAKQKASVPQQGLNSLLKAVAKPSKECPSCFGSFLAEKGGTCPSSGEHLCPSCIEPIMAAEAALVAEAKAAAEAQAVADARVAVEAKAARLAAEARASAEVKAATETAARERAHRDRERRLHLDLEQRRTNDAERAREKKNQESLATNRAAQRLAGLVKSMPTRQLVFGSTSPSPATITGRSMLDRHYAEFPRDAAIIQTKGIRAFSDSNKGQLWWTPSAQGSAHSGILTAAGNKAVPESPGAQVPLAAPPFEVTSDRPRVPEVQNEDVDISFGSIDDVTFNPQPVAVEIKAEVFVAPKPAPVEVDEECAICLEPIATGRICKLPCEHSYHVKCINEVKDFNNQVHAICPTCLFECKPGNTPPKRPQPPPPPPPLPIGDASSEILDMRVPIGANAGSAARFDFGGGYFANVIVPKGKRVGDTVTLRVQKNRPPITIVPSRSLERGLTVECSIHGAASDEKSNDAGHGGAALVDMLLASDLEKAAIRPEHEGNGLMGVLRNIGTSDSVISTLLGHGLCTAAAIMGAHDSGLGDIGVKKGPRMKIIKKVSEVTLPGEDEAVKVIKCSY